MSAPVDVSRNAQLRDIEASFAACNENFSLETLQHPNKPNVTAIESFPFLPDADIWANQYDLFRFSERPGDRPIEVCAYAIFKLQTQGLTDIGRSTILVWTVLSCAQ